MIPPPRPLRTLIRRLLPPRDAQAVIGDLTEASRRRGPGPGRLLWLVGQIASLLWWSLVDRVRSDDPIPDRSQPVSTFLFESRAALRGLRRSPGFAAAMIATIALGVGGTTAVFALVHGVLLAPLQYPQADELVAVWPEMWPSKAVFAELESGLEGSVEVAAWSGGSTVVGGEAEPELLLGPQVSAGFLEVLGYAPLHGRFLEPADNLPGAAPVVVISHELFASRFGGDPAIVGSTIPLDGEGATVVGVLPPGAELLQPDAVLVTPLLIDPDASEYRTGFYLRVVGRLQKGVPLEAARAELAGIARRLQEEFSFSDAQIAAAGVVPLREFVVGDQRPILLLLMGAVGLVLLVACVNAGNLNLARQLSRRREVAVRTALGGGRGRGLIFLASESLILAAVGGALGVALAAWTLMALRAANPVDLPRLAEVGLSPVVLAVTLLVTAATALVTAVVPGLRVARLAPADSLGGGRAASMGRSTRLLREGLVVVEVALAVVLVAGAGLMAHSLWELGSVDPGFEPDDRLVLQLVPPRQGVGHGMDVTSYYQRMLDGVEALPGVAAAASINAPPVRGGGWVMGTQIEGIEYGDRTEEPLSYWRVVAPGFFEALGTRVVRGRALRDNDAAGAVPVVVVDSSFARRHWPDADPVGKRIRIGWDTPDWLTVVGVVEDIRHLGVATDPTPTAYRPLAQAAPGLARVGVTSQSLILHTRGEPLSMLPAVREAVRDVDPGVAILDPATMEAILRRSLAEPRLLLQVLAGFGASALLLAAVGISGIVAYLVRQRRREFGIRQALGALPSQIVARSLGRGLWLGGLGLLGGTLAALALGPLMTGFLYRVSPRDPVTLAGVVAILAVSVSLASWIPSRQASRIDPAEALGVE